MRGRGSETGDGEGGVRLVKGGGGVRLVRGDETGEGEGE